MPKFLTTLVVILFAFNLAPAAAQVPFWEGNVTKIKVCTSEYTPSKYNSEHWASLITLPSLSACHILLLTPPFTVLQWFIALTVRLMLLTG